MYFSLFTYAASATAIVCMKFIRSVTANVCKEMFMEKEFTQCSAQTVIWVISENFVIKLQHLHEERNTLKYM